MANKTVSNFHLNNFMSNLKSGARSNQFYVDIALPAALQGSIRDGTNAQNKFRFSCKATSIPASTIGGAPVTFRGRKIDLPGDRVFDDWEVTVINDVDFLARNMFEQWADMCSGNVNGDSIANIKSDTELMGAGEVNQLSRNSEVLKSYNVIAVWPKIVAAIPLSWETNDTVEDFAVTFATPWWESDTTRNNVGSSGFGRGNTSDGAP